MESKETKNNGNDGGKGKAQFEYPIVGKSRAVDQLVKQIAVLAKSRRDIVIIGEAGVGKSAIAKNIYLSGKTVGNDGPFMSINLSTVDDRELELLLFGQDRNGQGVPLAEKNSVLEQGNHGTLLIENLEDASFRNQMKVLSFMNERKTRKAGDSGAPVDLRVILTMKAEPSVLVDQRKLLDELFTKLKDAEKVDIPPLRQRQEDIPLLIKHFTSEICRDLGVADLAIDINAVDVLVRQPWRENVRELKSVIDKCVLYSTDGRFMLPPELVDEKTEVVKMINNIMAGQEFVLDKSLDVIEKGIIERSLEKFGFNQSKAAQFLGMTEQTFRYKLKRLGIASARARS
ncbi:MAG: sigma-54-dependent Fis family transcriptional regulator [Bacteroidetes bacterium]|nr:sigma-54-dependent Fis family transcriptional regulator [Bacteroidota bacterium]